MDALDSYVLEVKNLDEYKRMLELNDIIKKKYGLLIISFKSLEAEYLSLKEYENYRNDVVEVRKKFQKKKEELYSKPEVKEYLGLERKLNEILNDDLNELKRSISNKYKENKMLKID